MILLANGHHLYVESYGPKNGHAVVLLHHGLGSVKAWKEQTLVLADVGYHATAYDRWGYGGSDARPVVLDLPAFTTDVDDLHSILQEYRLRQPILVGHSDGGTIALYYASLYPEQVSGLVVVGAHIYVEPTMEAGILGVKQAFDSDQRFRLGLRHAHGEKFEQVFHNWFDGWHRTELLAWDMRPSLSRISCQVLVAQGEDDEHATPQHAKDIANAIPGAELWLVPGAGHMLPQERPDLFNSRLLNFLENNHA
jgi:pimeloyl-ACP methyl ester carboxylesterase